MVIAHFVDGYENFKTFISDLEKDRSKKIYVYFGGSKLPNGESWCDDCERTKPIFDQVISRAPADIHVVYCEVGDRPTWKDLNCMFRKDAKTKLMVIPTIMRWNGPQVLTGDQCESKDLLEMMFLEEDD